MNELVATFKSSLFDSSLAGVATEIIETGIDSVLEAGLLKDIPIINLVVGVGQAAFKVRDYILLKQTMNFIAHLHDGSVTSEQFKKYKEELEQDPQKADRELSRVIILIDRIIDDEKTKMLASLFRAYIEKLVTWERFCELSEALDRLFITDVQMLKRIKNPEIKVLYLEGGYIADRLVSVGFVRNPTSNIEIGIGGFPSFGKIPLQLTDLGAQFIDLIDKQPILEE